MTRNAIKLFIFTFMSTALTSTWSQPKAVDVEKFTPLLSYSEKSNAKITNVGLRLEPSELKKYIGLEANSNTAGDKGTIKEEAKNRGAKEVQVYDQISAGTVLIVNDDGIGSGALVTEKGHIITNYHVVGNSKYVSVFFKPIGNKKIEKKDALRGEVTKINEFKDLALVKIDSIPSYARPIVISSNTTNVGEDAHAVGHPKGEFWSYTRGYVSAIRENYEWSSEEEKNRHKAKIVQTQTPINPGNSGGPLVNDDKKLIGINSFILPNSPGLNYAVSADDVMNFLRQDGSSFFPKKKQSNKKCGDEPVNSGTKNDPSDGEVEFIAFDLDCTGKINLVQLTPKDKSKPIKLLIDANGDGKIDVVVFDFDRDGKWDYSLHDSDYDGKYDLVGKHPDGKINPSSYEKYTG